MNKIVKMIFILFVVIILLSACGSDSETDSHRPAGRYRSMVDRAYQLVLEIHEDGKVTLFEQDIDSHAVDPEGRTYEGKGPLDAVEESGTGRILFDLSA